MGFRSAPDSQTAESLMRKFRDTYKILAAIGDETRPLIIAVLASEKCGGMRVGVLNSKALGRRLLSLLTTLKNYGIEKPGEE